jgi:hypothetical protein
MAGSETAGPAQAGRSAAASLRSGCRVPTASSLYGDSRLKVTSGC